MAYIKPAKPEHVYVKVTSDFDATDFMQWRVGKGTARRLEELGCFNSDDFSILSGIPTKTEIHPTEDWNYQAQAPSAFIIFSYLTEQMFLILHSNPLFLTIGGVL